jgi:dsRNA-specific ribonuclease
VGEGASRRISEQQAAQQALIVLKNSTLEKVKK